ncbi:MAG: hypothetical protein WCO06_06760 [Candidatus Roizmanbacteria bacterium]
MKKKIYIVIGAICVICAMIGWIIYQEIVIENGRMKEIIHARGVWVNENQKKITSIFESILPQARICAEKGTIPTSYKSYVDNCNGRIGSVIKSGYNSLFDKRLIGGGCLELNNTLCKEEALIPTYFIRLLNDNSFEKVYENGVYYVQQANTPNEKRIVEILEGKIDPFQHLYHSCCTSVDWLEYFPFLPSRVYLAGEPSEKDFVYPIKDSEGKIIGGVVWLSGD